jgi:hypothetical protein
MSVNIDLINDKLPTTEELIDRHDEDRFASDKGTKAQVEEIRPRRQ